MPVLAPAEWLWTKQGQLLSWQQSGHHYKVKIEGLKSANLFCWWGQKTPQRQNLKSTVANPETGHFISWCSGMGGGGLKVQSDLMTNCLPNSIEDIIPTPSPSHRVPGYLRVQGRGGGAIPPISTLYWEGDRDEQRKHRRQAEDLDFKFNC